MSKSKELLIPEIPMGSILGLHYNGCHDTSAAVINPNGEIIFACSLERLTRVKGDGRLPTPLLDLLPLKNINLCSWPFIEKSINTPSPEPDATRFHVTQHNIQNRSFSAFPEIFWERIKSIPFKQEWWGHEYSHAAATYFGSGFDNATILIYDGGTWNCPSFGGVYQGHDHTIKPVEMFPIASNTSFASFYAIITASLNFRPLRHEGKVMGLASYASPDSACMEILHDLLTARFKTVETAFIWFDIFNEEFPPRPIINEKIRLWIQEKLAGFSREAIAASLQQLLEDHVLRIIDSLIKEGLGKNLCLGGGLFANVKLNQRIAEHPKVKSLYICPATGDEGTAIGAAYLAWSNRTRKLPRPLTNTYLGPTIKNQAIEDFIQERKLTMRPETTPAEIASIIHKGGIVGVINGRMEFGSRALGNRSLLALATDSEINNSLNKKLSRTEFMPFAPITREEDIDQCYRGNWQKSKKTLQFMTVTLPAKEILQNSCPAVVHVDGTSRPQLVSQVIAPQIHAVLSEYQKLSSNNSLINTSFNLHEEPIVCTIDDAWRGFMQADLDALVINGYLIKKSDVANYQKEPANEKTTTTEKDLSRELTFLWNERHRFESSLTEKENVVQDLCNKLEKLDKKTGQEIKNLSDKLLKERNEQHIEQELLNQEIDALNGSLSVQWSFSNMLRELPGAFMAGVNNFVAQRGGSFCRASLGILGENDTPKPLYFPKQAKPKKILVDPPLISIVIPSYNHAHFLKDTIDSVFGQNYPCLEAIVVDGGSKDGSVDVIKQYDNQLSWWVSEPDNGQTHAINKGFSRTKGKVMAWLNSDDVLAPGTLHTVASFFNQHPEIDAVYGHRILVNDKGEELCRWILPPHDNEILKWADFVPQETLFWRRSLWERIGGSLDEDFHFAMDWDLLVRFTEAGAQMTRLPNFLGLFRIHEAQKTSCAIDDTGFKEMQRIRLRSIGYAPSQALIARRIAGYMAKSWFLERLWRLGLIKYD